MPTRNVVLTERQHAFVDGLVESGKYQNASEVLREGLRLIEHREQEHAAKLQALQHAVNQGWNEIANGDYIDVADNQLEGFISQLGDRPSATSPKE